MGTSESDLAQWKIPVNDGMLLRPRDFIVAAVETRVVILPPPGEGVVVPDESVLLMCEALNAALSVARHRRGQGGSS